MFFFGGLGSIQKVLICVRSTAAGTYSPNDFQGPRGDTWRLSTRPCDHQLDSAQWSSHKRSQFRRLFFGDFFTVLHFHACVIPDSLPDSLPDCTWFGGCRPSHQWGNTYHLTIEIYKKTQMSNQLPPESRRKQYKFAKCNFVAMITSKAEERTDVTHISHTRDHAHGITILDVEML